MVNIPVQLQMPWEGMRSQCGYTVSLLTSEIEQGLIIMNQKDSKCIEILDPEHMIQNAGTFCYISYLIQEFYGAHGVTYHLTKQRNKDKEWFVGKVCIPTENPS